MIEPILEGPVEWANLSTVIKNQFTLNGRISEQHYFLHENTSSKVGPVWTKHMISSGILRACRRQDIREIRTYDPRSVFDLYKVLDKYSVVNKDVLVTGSLLPWIEVCCLAFGARTVTTVDYNPPVSEYEEIRTVGVEYFENETFKYDVIISYSRLEHDGLGRYGDSIDPEADIKRMRSYLNFIKTDGFMLMGVPCGKDALYWNAHRIYGEIRFPMLTEHWNIIDFFLEGFTPEQVFSWEDSTVEAWSVQPWWVLKPEMVSKFSLMPFQHECFNGDIYVADLFLNLAKRNFCNIAFETGTCLGGTTKFLSANFDKVYTVEINEEFQTDAKKWVGNKFNVEFVLGASENVSEGLIKSINQSDNVIFFLDAHWNDYCPLLAELELISQYRKGNDCIVIHDFKVPNNPELGFDYFNGQAFDLEWIKPYLDSIYGVDNYNYFYNTEAYAAKRGVLFVEPKDKGLPESF